MEIQFYGGSKMNVPLISVIVPVYNADKHLGKCLDSILNQSYHNLEIILVDDGSTDNSASICDEYASKNNRIKVLHKKNSGQASARNTGIEMAVGEFITFVDDDDWIESNMYEVLMNNAMRFNADISGCATVMDYEGAKSVYPFEKAKTGIISKDEVCLNIMYQTNLSWGTVWNKIFRRELFDTMRFPAGCELEDYYVIFQMVCKADVIFFDNKPLYHWIQRTTSQSKRSFHAGTVSEIFVADSLAELFQQADVSAAVKKGSQHFSFIIYSNVLWSCYKSGKPEWKEQVKPYFKNARRMIVPMLFDCKSSNDVKRLVKLILVILKSQT